MENSRNNLIPEESSSTADNQDTSIAHFDETLMHVFQCPHSSNCRRSDCLEMKDYWKHRVKCERKESGECNICNLLKSLLFYHYQNCNVACQVPCCAKSKARRAEIQNQQRRQYMKILLNNMTVISYNSCCRPNYKPTQIGNL